MLHRRFTFDNDCFRPTFVHTPRLMHEGLGWCSMSLADVSYKMHTFYARECRSFLILYVIGRRRFLDMIIPRLWIHVLDEAACNWPDVACMMHTCHVRCVHVMADVGCFWATSTDQCVESMDDKWGHVQLWKKDMCRLLKILAGHIWYHLTNVCMLRIMLASHVRLWQSDVCGLRTMMASHIRRQLIIVCMPKAMRVNRVKHWQNIMYRPKAIRVGHAWR